MFFVDIFTLLLFLLFANLVVVYRMKGNDTNEEAEREFRVCTAIALKHPYKSVLTVVWEMRLFLFPL